MIRLSEQNTSFLPSNNKYALFVNVATKNSLNCKSMPFSNFNENKCKQLKNQIIKVFYKHEHETLNCWLLPLLTFIFYSVNNANLSKLSSCQLFTVYVKGFFTTSDIRSCVLSINKQDQTKFCQTEKFDFATRN